MPVYGADHVGGAGDRVIHYRVIIGVFENHGRTFGGNYDFRERLEVFNVLPDLVVSELVDLLHTPIPQNSLELVKKER